MAAPRAAQAQAAQERVAQERAAQEVRDRAAQETAAQEVRDRAAQERAAQEARDRAVRKRKAPIDIRATNPAKQSRAMTAEEVGQERRKRIRRVLGQLPQAARQRQAQDRAAQEAREREAQEARDRAAQEAREREARMRRKRKAPVDIRATNARKKSRGAGAEEEPVGADSRAGEGAKSDSEPEAPRRSARVAAGGSARPIPGEANITDPAMLTELVQGTQGRTYREIVQFVAQYRRAHPGSVPAGMHTHSLASSLNRFHTRPRATVESEDEDED